MPQPTVAQNQVQAVVNANNQVSGNNIGYDANAPLTYPQNQLLNAGYGPLNASTADAIYNGLHPSSLFSGQLTSDSSYGASAYGFGGNAGGNPTDASFMPAAVRGLGPNLNGEPTNWDPFSTNVTVSYPSEQSIVVQVTGHKLTADDLAYLTAMADQNTFAQSLQQQSDAAKATYQNLTYNASNGFAAAGWHIAGLLSEVGNGTANGILNLATLPFNANARAIFTHNAGQTWDNLPAVIGGAVTGFVNAPFSEKADTVFKLAAGAALGGGVFKTAGVVGSAGIDGTMAVGKFALSALQDADIATNGLQFAGIPIIPSTAMYVVPPGPSLGAAGELETAIGAGSIIDAAGGNGAAIEGDVATNVSAYPDGSFRTPDGKFASVSGMPAPGTVNANNYADFLSSNGVDVAGTELEVDGPLGVRRYDFMTVNSDGSLFGVEIKSGGGDS